MSSERCGIHAPARPVPAGDDRQQQLLGVGAALGAEAAADVGGDDPDLLRLEIPCTRASCVADRMRALARRVVGEAAVVAPLGGGDARLDGARARPAG